MLFVCLFVWGGGGGGLCYFCNTFDFGLMAGEEIRLNVIPPFEKKEKNPFDARFPKKKVTLSISLGAFSRVTLST